MKRYLAITIALLCCGFVAACGTTRAPTSTTTTAPAATACPRGHSYMGCAEGAPAAFSQTPTFKLSGPPPAGQKFPDVSSYQGCDLNWARIGAAGAVIKLGEGESVADPCAAHNLAGLAAAHKRAVVYWFVRPDSISAESAFIVARLKAEHITINHVVIYTAPGTWPGGSNGGLNTWEAAYTGTTTRPALPYSGGVLAWQYTDSGYTAGLGYGDLSVDYGLLKLAPHVLVLDEEVPGIAGYAAPLAQYVLAHDPARSDTAAQSHARARARAAKAKAAERATLTGEIRAERRHLRSMQCYRYRYFGACPAALKRGDHLHAELSRLG
jgi:hypothetical protein